MGTYTQNEMNASLVIPSSNDFANRIDLCVNKGLKEDTTFFIVVIQLSNLTDFKKRRQIQVYKKMMTEIGRAVRKAVHPSQYVGYFQDGIGVIFDGVDSGKVDQISNKLCLLIQHVIRTGKYNDITSQWSDIIFQFLHPNRNTIVFPHAGWAIYPRDGQNTKELARRALIHIDERVRNL